ncbi:TfoX family protein [Leptospira langatensis]|uniref:TfoX family protein n=1 Tax=Leptospira langatensis TaxID=2484983 RepID=A0A5F1ZUE2_9LEPT|nr:TfoX/Sxy family protein [Leptospira langatensis]TGK00305.1 TfoX family protein [Leptospira langatensis]TGL41059.1 TfoX family protein [Leptospira langatensis]
MSSFLTHVQDRLKVCGPLTYKNMFGGYGVYSGSQIFAMVIKDHLYFRVGPSNQAEYEASGMAPFSYSGKDGKIVRVSYWEVPEEILEDDEDLIFWFRKSLAEANKAASLKKKTPSKKKVSRSIAQVAKRLSPKKKAVKKKTSKLVSKKKTSKKPNAKKAAKKKVASKKKRSR